MALGFLSRERRVDAAIEKKVLFLDFGKNFTWKNWNDLFLENKVSTALRLWRRLYADDFNLKIKIFSF